MNTQSRRKYVKEHWKSRFRRKIKYNRKTGICSVSNSSSLDDSCSSLSHISNSKVKDISFVISNGDNDSQVGVFEPPRSSTPIIFYDNEDLNISSSNSDDSQQLYRKSDVSVEHFTSKFNSLICKNRITDIAANNVLQFIANVLPVPNCCPTFYQLKKRQRYSDMNNYVQIVRDETHNGTYYSIDLQFQIELLMKSYSQFFQKNIAKCVCGDFNDVKCGSYFPNSSHDNSVILIYTDISADGVKPIHSSKGYKLWPIMMSVLNLPPSERAKFRNILLSNMYYGKSKPDYEQLLRYTIDNISKTIFIHNGVTILVKPLFLIADLPAKAALINMSPYNAYYGCSVCCIKGEYSHAAHTMVFAESFSDSFVLRTPQMHDRYIQKALANGKSYKGVKGPSLLANLFNLPINAPLDCMHLLYLGITKRFVEHFLKKQLLNVIILNKLLITICVPSFFKRYPRSLDERPFWKAQEYKFLLFFIWTTVSQCIFDDEKLQLMISLLSIALYVLSKDTVSENELSETEILLEAFHRLYMHMFGKDSCVYSVHALVHLSKQVKCFGPLWTTSASKFESCYALMKTFVTGTTNEASIIIRRYINYKLFYENPSTLTSHNSQCRYDLINVDVRNYIENTFGICVCFKRYVCNGMTIHAKTLYEKKRCASYRIVTESEEFLEVEAIIRFGERVHFVCTKYIKILKCAATLNMGDLQEKEKQALCNLCPSYIVSKPLTNKYCSILETDIKNFFILFQINEDLFVCPLNNNKLEHD
jgi:hypothetical protein